MTSVAAERFGLRQHGVLGAGMAADMVLFDDAIDDTATFDTPTLLPSGVHHVWVAGQAIVEHGQSTGRLPGRVL
jgi:N-acyl-D-amino-acid deacylase